VPVPSTSTSTPATNNPAHHQPKFPWDFFNWTPRHVVVVFSLCVDVFWIYLQLVGLLSPPFFDVFRLFSNPFSLSPIQFKLRINGVSTIVDYCY
jgi:hypothetical protein